MLDYCPGCRQTTADKLYEYRGGRYCGVCILALEKDLGGFGFAPHGREPSEIVKRVFADREILTQERLKEAKRAENSSRD